MQADPLLTRLSTIKDRISNDAAGVKKWLQSVGWFSGDDALLLGCYSFFCGIADWFVQRWFDHHAALLHFEWTMAFRPPDYDLRSYNGPFVAYTLLVLLILGAVFAKLLLGYFPRMRALARTVAEKVWRTLMVLSPLSVLMAPHMLAILGFFIAAVVLAIRRFVVGDGSCKPYSSFAGRIVAFCAFVMILAGLWIGTAAWYPVKVSNDYFELPDTISIPAFDKNNPVPFLQIDRPSLTDCLNALSAKYADKNGNAEAQDIEKKKITVPLGSKDPEGFITSQRIVEFMRLENLGGRQQATPVCRYPLSQYYLHSRLFSFFDTGYWQSQAGRLFYHHSYLFVPAVHILRYGPFSPIPMLYGFGNTLFHAALMLGKPLTISSYLDTFPIAQLTGILLIVGCIFYITRSWLAVPAACAAVLLPFWHIGFEALQMAPGFNPLRYAGLAIQLTSIFVVFRGKSSVRIAALYLALVFSLFWNKEFAVLGLFGQIFALLSPPLRLSPYARVAGVVIFMVTVAAAMLGLNAMAQGYLQTVQAGIYGIAVPSIGFWRFLHACILVIAIVTMSIVVARRFPAAERWARFCLVPVLCLLMIKYVYNATPVHLMFTISFLAPFFAVFVDWQGTNWRFFSWTPKEHDHRFTNAAIFFSALCLLGGIQFYLQTERYLAGMVDPYVQNSWSDIGESFLTTTPAAPIESRMQAVRAEIKPDDAVLFLSPFDHLMSFYANPKTYCGHFEILTNLVTFKAVDSVVDCALHNPHALVVYDDAVETPCPSPTQISSLHLPSCEAKKLLTQQLQSIMTTIKPHMVLIKKDGPLSFYRPVGGSS